MVDKHARRVVALLAGVAITGSAIASVAPAHRVPATVSSPVSLSATVLAMGGLGYETVDPELMKRALGGYFADAETLVGLPWPGEMAPFNGTRSLGQSVAVGLENMDAAIRATPGPKIVAGASGSTLVVDEVMRRLADDPTAPPADELSFVVMGDANRGIFKQFRGVTLPVFDYTVPQIPETQYDVMVVTGEYDGLGDWPDRWNPLAAVNALAGTGFIPGFGSVHFDAMFADPRQVPAKNVTTTVNSKGGVTTTYVIPTAELPILRPLRDNGVPDSTVTALKSVLKPIVDAGYRRNDAHPTTGASARKAREVTSAPTAGRAGRRG